VRRIDAANTRRGTGQYAQQLHHQLGELPHPTHQTIDRPDRGMPSPRSLPSIRGRGSAVPPRLYRSASDSRRQKIYSIQHLLLPNKSNSIAWKPLPVSPPKSAHPRITLAAEYPPIFSAYPPFHPSETDPQLGNCCKKNEVGTLNPKN
jgi:hypothetical protein